jgi:hypothetical protein
MDIATAAPQYLNAQGKLENIQPLKTYQYYND